MKRKPILITAAALALFAWPLCAQENAPVPPQQNPPPHEDGPRRPEAVRPEGPRDPEARPQNRDGGPREGRFRREDGQMRRPDRGPDQRRDDRSDRQYGPPPQQAGPGGDSRREGLPPPQMQGDRREGPQTAPRRGEYGPRFGQRGRGPEDGMPPPRMQRRGDRFASGPGESRFGQREFGMRRHHRQMKDNYGVAPRRGDDPGFRRGGNEMRAPMPPPQRGSEGDRFGSDRGPGPGRDQMDRRPPPNGPREMMRPRPDFERGDREDHGPRQDFNGPRPQMGPPHQDDRGPRPERPHRGGPPPQGSDEGQRQPI